MARCNRRWRRRITACTGAAARLAWYAENPAQRIRARFPPDGVQLQATPRHGDAPRIDMKLRSVGYGSGKSASTPLD